MLEGPDRPLFPEIFPVGLGTAMLLYPGALEKYSNLPEEARQAFSDGAQDISSAEEMEHYVNRFLTGI